MALDVLKKVMESRHILRELAAKHGFGNLSLCKEDGEQEPDEASVFFLADMPEGTGILTMAAFSAEAQETLGFPAPIYDRKGLPTQLGNEYEEREVRI